MPGRADGVEHGGEELIAVGERGDSIPTDCGRREQAAHRAQELFVADRKQVLDPVIDFLLARGEDTDD